MVKSRSSLIESSRVDRTAATEPDESNALWPISSRAHLLPIGPLCSPSTNAYFTVAHAHGFHERAHSTKMQHRRVVQELICGVVQALMHISQSHMHMDSMNAHTPQRCNIAE